MPDKSIFSQFTNLYSLTKTLRFELKPIGKTLENLWKAQGKDENLQTFLKDQEIEVAYQTLKPELDKKHEEFINQSLKCEEAKNVNFEKYLELYRNKQDNLKKLGDEEKKLRANFEALFKKTGEILREKLKSNDINIEAKVKSYNILLSKQFIQYLKKDYKNDKKVKDAAKKIYAAEKIEKFYGYMSGYNTNRANYYSLEDKATGIANRCINENLAKFCDNLLQFECITKTKTDKTTKIKTVTKYDRKEEYLHAYQYLKENGKTTLIKDAKTNEMIEAIEITADIFEVNYFVNCLSQVQIEAYNQKIGNYNLLINLYNQAKKSEKKDLKKDEKIFKSLPQFKTLFKQIGCGKTNASFFAITHDTKAHAEKEKQNNKNAFSLEEVLALYNQAGQKYFAATENFETPQSIPDLISYISNLENYSSVYWSKQAINSISNLYFANWHSVQELLTSKKVFNKGDKKNGYQVKIPEVVCLDDLFETIDSVEDWKESMFKTSLFDNIQLGEELRNKRKKILENSNKPSEALLGFIFTDINFFINEFKTQSENVLKLTDYKNNIKEIKAWLDNAKKVIQITKYFLVNENKIKGESVDANVTNFLSKILYDEDAKWFSWYDAVRNYLTKKPQDDAKENKLKLNFNSTELLAGWDLNEETKKLSIILQDQTGKKYLAITNKENNKLFEKEFSSGRGNNKITTKNELYTISDNEAYFKMEYKLLKDASRSIPKSSTQVKDVTKHFKQSSEDFKLTKGSSVGDFTKPLLISRDEWELNNYVFLKSNLDLPYVDKNTLNENQKKNYISRFQKGYWDIVNEEYKTDDKIFDEENEIKKIEYIKWQKKHKAIYKKSLKDWINFCKRFLECYPSCKYFDYSGLKPTEEYHFLNDFYHDVDVASYSLTLDTKIDKLKLDKFVDEGKVYLFEIKNQDNNENKKENHKDNLHSMYWNAIFKNLENRPKLDGQAEVFYRKAVPKLNTKKDKSGKEIIDGYRFSKEKFLFHVPITLNFALDEKSLNTFVNKNFKVQDDVYFLGIDRGEKHLAYYCLVNQKAEIIKQGSLNIPFVDSEGNPRIIEKIGSELDKESKQWKDKIFICENYNDLLEATVSNRDKARENWEQIGKIKDLKNGYISLVVKKIVDEIIDLDNPKPTYVVLEDLNSGFMRGRQKIEKSVYQKLELALAKKLNFVVDKKVETGLGSVTEALQLTPPVSNFQDIENNKQVGVMLYTRANYTSQTDPVTGWRKSIYIQRGSEAKIEEQIMSKFDDFYRDGKDFIFEYKVKGKKDRWKLYSSKDGVSLDRFRGKRGEDKNEWTIEQQDINTILNTIFKGFEPNRSLKDQLVEKSHVLQKYGDMKPWDSLRYAIDLIQQIRNTGLNERDNDYILSPVRNNNGEHFDSREHFDLGDEKAKFPTCGDALGAFNIARKGIIMFNGIKNAKDIEKIKNEDLFVSDEDWDKWLYENTKNDR
jgi:CRISPR-associated protein Cpf1